MSILFVSTSIFSGCAVVKIKPQDKEVKGLNKAVCCAFVSTIAIFLVRSAGPFEGTVTYVPS